MQNRTSATAAAAAAVVASFHVDSSLSDSSGCQRPSNRRQQVAFETHATAPDKFEATSKTQTITSWLYAVERYMRLMKKE